MCTSRPARSERYQRCTRISWNSSAGSSLPRASGGTICMIGSYIWFIPPFSTHHRVPAAELEVRGERRHVVEHPPRLGVLDVQPGQRLQLAAVVPELDDPGLDPHLVAVEVGDDVELLDVEAELVEPLDALLDAPHLVGGELLLGGELGPQRVVALLEHLDDL